MASNTTSLRPEGWAPTSYAGCFKIGVGAQSSGRYNEPKQSPAGAGSYREKEIRRNTRRLLRPTILATTDVIDLSNLQLHWYPLDAYLAPPPGKGQQLRLSRSPDWPLTPAF